MGDKPRRLDYRAVPPPPPPRARPRGRDAWVHRLTWLLIVVAAFLFFAFVLPMLLYSLGYRW